MTKINSLSAMSLIVNKMVGTGIFLTPSIILQYCQGNIGLYLILWLLGSLVVACGIIIYLEFALHLPIKNGGEKNYLQRIFNRRLIGLVYAFQIVILGFSSGNSYAFGKYILYSINGDLGDEDSLNNFYVKLIGVFCISYCTYLHVFHHHQSNFFFIFLGVSKLLILMLVILCGGLVFFGVIDLPKTDNFHNVFEQHEKTNYYSISVALLEIIYSFKGWENVNYVLSETKNPYKVLTRSAPSAVLITTTLYFLVILSYLVVIPKAEILLSGVLISGIFFNKIFGQNITARVLPLLIAVSNFGNVLVVSYSHSIVNKELASENLIPFSKTFSKFRNALGLHWLVTVIVLVLPPSSEIYEFIVNLYIYPGTWINILLTGGLLYLRYFDESWNTLETSEFDHLLAPKAKKKLSAPLIVILIFLAANLFMALFPFIKPPHYELIIPYWCFPFIGTGVLFLGVIYYFFTDILK